MRRMRLLAAAILISASAACATDNSARPAAAGVFTPPMGSNQIFHEALSAAPGHELIAADLALGPDAAGQAHWHPWEEYLYVLAGSALVEIEGEPQRVVLPGQSFIIPARAVHTPRAGSQGVRAIVLRVHDAGDPESVPAETKETE
ncbi:quercetin dioxygenase-like cupin family protein [Altererythrobacter atlanticus]|uniref:Cupin domain protein n=1 Tax=Croceibacterium atlanticum TaxID=1267766 RepID=A0A0F7KSR2_9SPHN|nr:cupin domain-containing protein [Croceibacterium atlanticum]AKH43448.1 Cupin domain protein [Croceibacterium atlanticum]MBB5731844.1 quercetin dioxygenase-like cupin family protein [Croceibacterium atlanticum]